MSDWSFTKERIDDETNEHSIEIGVFDDGKEIFKFCVVFADVITRDAYFARADEKMMTYWAMQTMLKDMLGG